ncbi:hypothetical protein [Meiothermus sp.]|jgi:hypothetical protein|uniref:hypothetical protein n=1 Tax=Meiothermus sp. TaxID=1955249 RepID=UPI0021DEA330|nr:hypothetical protein [Meiothermus sp.]GIW24574.1 MAG: hypothetical protein KatS3mg069_0841 [Meiothermus sp.]
MFLKSLSYGRVGYVLFFVGLLSALFVSCTGPATQDPEQVFRDVVEEVAQEAPLYSKVEPMVLPDKILAAAAQGNLAAKRLVEWAQVLNQSREIRGHPSPPSLSESSMKTDVPIATYTLASELSPTTTKECTSLPYPICTYTWYENNGQLKVTALFMSPPEQWYLGIFYNGEFGGYHYQDEPIQVWQTKKDLKWSAYMYYAKMPPCSAETILNWLNLTWVDGEGTLCIGGIGCRLLYETHWISEAYTCVGEYHPVWRLETVSNPPVGNIQTVWRRYNWSLSKKTLYLWVETVYTADYRYCETEYNENRQVVNRECGNW